MSLVQISIVIQLFLFARLNFGHFIADKRSIINQNVVDYQGGEQPKPILVRLDIYYDPSTLAHMDGNRDQVEKLIKGVIGSTQLVYRQPEMRSYIEIAFRIVGIQMVDKNYLKCSFKTASINNILSDFKAFIDTKYQTKSFQDHADIAVLFNHKTQWSATINANKLTRVLGLAIVGTFCSPTDYTAGGHALVVEATSIVEYLVLAHELAHVFGVQHDADRGGSQYEVNCKKSGHIMGPGIGITTNTWSACSAKRLVANMMERASCAYDTNRWKTPAYKPGMDFEKSSPIDGIPSLDEQCKLMLGQRAFYQLQDQSSDPCYQLNCQLDHLIVNAGTALTGTKCSYGSVTNGICKLAGCFAQ